MTLPEEPARGSNGPAGAGACPRRSASPCWAHSRSPRTAPHAHFRRAPGASSPCWSSTRAACSGATPPAGLTPLLETASARASLRKALTRLRATRLPLVETDGATLRLHPRVMVDVREAEALAARIGDRSQPLPGDARLEILMLTPLAGWDDEWAGRARAVLQGRFLRALDGYARRLASRGDVDQALAVAQRTWDSEPLHQSAAGVLIGIHLADGNDDQALRVYHALERHLAEARGREPSEVLRALVAPLLDGRPRS